MEVIKDFCRRVQSINWTNTNCVEKRLTRFYGTYGSFVSGHPRLFIFFPILLSIALSIGYFQIQEITDATFLYTPVEAKAKYERRCIHEKWTLVDGNYVPGRSVTQLREAQSIVTASDRGNILRPEYAQAVIRFNLFVLYDITIQYNNRTYNYLDLCLHWKDSCFTNPQVGLVSTMYNNPNFTSSNLTYPTAIIGNSSVYLASSLGDVRINDHSGSIESAHAWLLIYQLRFLPDDINFVTGLWELEFQRQVLNYSDPYIRVTVFHSQTMSLELKRNADELAPRFALSLAILILFATLITFAFVSGSRIPCIDWATSKPLLALCGVLGAGMAVASAIGLLAYCGYMYNAIVGVMPFLILAIALNDTFLMISALRRTDRSLPVDTRISTALSQAASAITVTVTADFFSFLSGIASDIPAVRIFCVHTAVAIVMTFIYQMTFFLGVLVLATKKEETGQHSMIPCIRTVPPQEARNLNILTRLFNQGTRSTGDLPIQIEGSRKAELDWISRWFKERYAPCLMNRFVRGFVVFLFCCYLAFTGYLCTQVQQGLESVKLLVRGSYAIPHYLSLEEYYWRNGSEMQLVVNNAPDMANEYEQDRVKKMVNEFATTNHSLGLEGVQFWLFDFERYQENIRPNGTEEMSGSSDVFYYDLERFLSLATYEKYSQDLYWENGQFGRRISGFRVIIGLTHFETANLQIDTVDTMRRLASSSRYVDMNITTFNPVWLFVDQYQGVLPNIVREVIIGMCFMVVIALLLIPHPVTSLWVAITILSVDIGVVGFMTLWGINLDTISMITIIMSIGFSVDFAAYIAHAFVLSANHDASATEKVKTAMGEIAWPILQGSTSTILGVIVLADLDSYMVVAFFKTVFLVIVLALIHGLVFLPVLLSIFVTSRCTRRRSRNGGNSNEATVQYYSPDGARRVNPLINSPSTPNCLLVQWPNSPGNQCGEPSSPVAGARSPPTFIPLQNMATALTDNVRTYQNRSTSPGAWRV